MRQWAGKLCGIIDANQDATDLVTTTGYDLAGNKVFRIDPNGNQADVTYDHDNRPVSMLGPAVAAKTAILLSPVQANLAPPCGCFACPFPAAFSFRKCLTWCGGCVRGSVKGSHASVLRRAACQGLVVDPTFI